MSRTTIRDHTLFVLLTEDQQLPLELELLNHAIQVAARSLWGTVQPRDEHMLFITWEISTYQDAGQVRRRLEQYLPCGIRWFLRSKNRVEYRNVSAGEVELILELTDFADTRSF